MSCYANLCKNPCEIIECYAKWCEIMHNSAKLWWLFAKSCNPCKIMQNYAKLCKIMWNPFCIIMQNYAKLHRILQNYKNHYTKLCEIMQNHETLCRTMYNCAKPCKIVHHCACQIVQYCANSWKIARNMPNRVTLCIIM